MGLPKPKISDEDREKIAQLRTLAQDYLTTYYDTDFNLLRWLQGHQNLSIAEISRKLIHHLQMRKCEWNVDAMHRTDLSHPVNDHWVNGATTLAASPMQNCIVFVEQCGRIDYSGMLESYSLSEVMKARLPVLEHMLNRCMQVEEETGEQGSVIFVMDLTELEYNKKLYDLVTGKMKELAQFMADHYVELVKTFIVLNAPSFIYVFWTAVKPLLPERTKNKVRILSSKWKTEMLELCGPEACPSYWSDDAISFNAKVPFPKTFAVDQYYSELQKKVPEGLETVDIVAGKEHIVEMNLNKGDQLSYFVTGNRNMGFGIFKKDSNKEDVDVHVLPQLVPTFCWMPGPIIVPLEDTLNIREDGTYLLWLSNAKSWWSSVTVEYRLKIGDPNGNIE